VRITDGLAARARLAPHAEALLTPSRSLDCAALEALVRAGCARLAREGVAPDDVVGVCCLDPARHVLATLALARLGVPQISLPPTEPPGTRAAFARRLRLAAIVGDCAQASDAGVPVMAADDAWFEPGGAPDGAALDVRDPSRTLFVSNSSGTTGEPKFARLSHAAGLARIERDRVRGFWREGERFLSLVPVQYRLPTQRVAFSLDAGACLCVPDASHGLGRMLELIERWRVRVVCASVVDAVRLARAVGGAREPFASVRILQVEGSSAGEEVRRYVRSQLCERLYVNYGSNEAGPIAIASPDDQDRYPGTVGPPAHGLRLQVVDASGRPLPPGEIGEIRLQGASLIDGYVEDAAANARAFRDGWFHQGDLGSLNDFGRLFLHGRVDDMMVFDGINIYPAEIERALLAHPLVEDAVAFPIRSPIHQDVPGAAIVVRAPVDDDALFAHCRALIGVKTPRALLRLPRLPRDAMGKVATGEFADTLARRLAGSPPGGA